MKLQQLRFLREIARQDFNISDAARALLATQPGLSKQIRQLEQELGAAILIRQGNRVLGLTELGRSILPVAERMLEDAERLKGIADDFKDAERGSFVIAATHTQARYALSDAITRFKRAHPKIHLGVRQGTPTEVARMVATGSADVSFGTEPVEPIAGVVLLRCKTLPRIVLAPAGHEILAHRRLTIARLATYPIITYDQSFSARRAVQRAFDEAGLEPNIVLSAIDSDVIKTYTAAGLGLAIVPEIAFEPSVDTALRALPAGHLFAPCTVVMGVPERHHLRNYMFEFIASFDPGWGRAAVERERARQSGATGLLAEP